MEMLTKRERKGQSDRLDYIDGPPDYAVNKLPSKYLNVAQKL